MEISSDVKARGARPHRAMAALGLLLGSVWPVAAGATCASADDLAGGIRFEMPSGASWDLSGQGADRVAYFQWSPDFPTQRMDLTRDIFIVSLVSEDMAEPWRAEFAPLPSASPSPGLTWETRMSSSGLGINRVDGMTYTFGAAQELSFGACRYTYLPMTLQSDPISTEGDRNVSEYFYFPELGGVVIQSDGYGNSWPITGISAR
ncbi:hypothetical protein [Gymnodinialimonas hymeniacidonis]|uniref:hypothetical protein n=1 Tax=Gymnodinialimonas hymeniacidonis TaxID=3126508 RepID=UPI0034C639D8